MIYQSKEGVQEVVSDFVPDLKEWIDDDRNISLTDGEGNFSLLTYEEPFVYSAHGFCTARGKVAKEFLLASLEYLFTKLEVKALLGLTPLEKKHSRWMNRQIGFHSHGIVGDYELFILTKEQWLDG